VLPDGSLFGEGVKTRLKEHLLEECKRHTIVRLPNSVFKPYASIGTNLLFRLAALDLRRDSHSRMPLILDDVLITSDDDRAANVLRALATFAQHGQVLLFTHHRHLIDVARSAIKESDIAAHNL